MSLGAGLLLGVHILGATIWVGGTFALGIVVRTFPPASARSVEEEERIARLARALSGILWPALAVTILTGVANLASLYPGGPTAWYASPAGPVLLVKFALVVAMTGFAAGHSFVVGPRIRRARRAGAPVPVLRQLQALNGALGGLTAVTSAAVVVLAAVAGNL